MKILVSTITAFFMVPALSFDSSIFWRLAATLPAELSSGSGSCWILLNVASNGKKIQYIFFSSAILEPFCNLRTRYVNWLAEPVRHFQSTEISVVPQYDNLEFRMSYFLLHICPINSEAAVTEHIFLGMFFRSSLLMEAIKIWLRDFADEWTCCILVSAERIGVDAVRIQ